jgi:hypothetical protein
MMKRILLILAVGVSFAPAAFADNGLLSVRVCVAHPGEDSQCQLDQAVGAAQCERGKALAETIREYGLDGHGNAGSARN